METNSIERFPWLEFIIMASTTFIAMISQNMPAGLLFEMSEGLGVSEARIGDYIGVYALLSAIAAIPLASATLKFNRKNVLLWIMIAYFISNLGIALVDNFVVSFAFRLLGGVAAGLIWAMISAYGLKIAPSNRTGQAVAVIIGGSTVAITVGTPLFTWIGTTYGWRISFLVLAILIAVVIVLILVFLPSVSGDERTESTSISSMFKNKGILFVVLLTFLAVIANYGIFTYMAVLVENINFNGGVELAQLFVGIGSLVAVFIAAKYLDTHLKGTIAFMMAIGAVSLSGILLIGQSHILNSIFLFLWGIGFGSLVTIFQGAVIKQVETGQSVATSIQSSSFNFGIMLGSTIFGWTISGFSMSVSLILAIALLVVATILSLADKKYLVK